MEKSSLIDIIGFGIFDKWVKYEYSNSFVKNNFDISFNENKSSPLNEKSSLRIEIICSFVLDSLDITLKIIYLIILDQL